jgi:hypothetical protein
MPTNSTVANLYTIEISWRLHGTGRRYTIYSMRFVSLVCNETTRRPAYMLSRKALEHKASCKLQAAFNIMSSVVVIDGVSGGALSYFFSGSPNSLQDAEISLEEMLVSARYGASLISGSSRSYLSEGDCTQDNGIPVNTSLRERVLALTKLLIGIRRTCYYRVCSVVSRLPCPVSRYKRLPSWNY